jgi:1-aminocyclopropane-1-carboxylate deaminase/D-cysteine desulfhydrase-like pyridoxal-dependent ACC family enzyme
VARQRWVDEAGDPRHAPVAKSQHVEGAVAEALASVLLADERELCVVLDPVYTGKAFSRLWDLAESGALRGERVLFLHTGGLPGLLAQGEAFVEELAGPLIG